MDDEAAGKRRNSNPQFDEGLRDLLPVIQSLLPIKEAARSCLLSKAWRDAWYTMPALTLPQSAWYFKEQEKKFMTYIDHTLLRYHRDRIPLHTIHLDIDIRDQDTASLVENWIRTVASKRFLRVLRLKMFCCVPTFSLTDEIFSGENVHTISVVLDTWMIGALEMTIDAVVKCVSLRELELIRVHISEEMLDKLFSTCRLLEKISLSFDTGFNTIKVINLTRLRELKITSRGRNDVLKVDNVPSLRLFSYDSSYERHRKPVPMDTSSLRGVTELYLDGVIIDDAFLTMIQYDFPFLENLTLIMKFFNHQETLDITSVSLKRLTLGVVKNGSIEIQVYAPKLSFFSYQGKPIPSFLFRATAPRQIELQTSFIANSSPLFFDHLFSFKMKEALIGIPSKFQFLEDLISPPVLLLNSDNGPIRNVSQQVVGSWDRSPYLDVVFTICHPSYLQRVHNQGPRSFGGKNNHHCKIMIKEVMNMQESREGYWADYLQDITIKDHYYWKVYQIVGE